MGERFGVLFEVIAVFLTTANRGSVMELIEEHKQVSTNQTLVSWLIVNECVTGSLRHVSQQRADGAHAAHNSGADCATERRG